MSWMPEAVATNLRAAGAGHLRMNVPLAQLGRWEIGGPADILLEPSSVAEVQAAMRVLAEDSIPSMVIGDGSNLLFDDAGFRGVVVRIGRHLSRVTIGPDGHVLAQAGAWVPSFVRTVAKAGLAGCIHAIGIPGTLGGLVVMNGGSQRRGIGDQILDVTIVDTAGDVHKLSREECAFAYRKSRLQGMNAVVVEASFRYAPGDPRIMRREMLAILAERNRKFPRKLPNCGSVFLSDPAMYDIVGAPGRAIEETGLKGTARGGAMISPLHANFIVNTGGARATDVLELIQLSRTRVHDRTGFLMDCEVRFLAQDGRCVPAHVAASELVGHA